MKFYKFISAVLHPLVMPTIGVLLYFIFVPLPFDQFTKLKLIAFVFCLTYIMPIVSLYFLKRANKVASFDPETIEERRLPMIIMVIVFLTMGKLFSKIDVLVDLSGLFYGTAFAVIVAAIPMLYRIKTSLHLLSMGCALGFLLNMHKFYELNLLYVICLVVIASGLLGTSRLVLSKHKPLEVYIGFTIGLVSQLFIAVII